MTSTIKTTGSIALSTQSIGRALRGKKRPAAITEYTPDRRAAATLALCRLSPSEMLRIVEMHITTREGIPGFSLEEMANRLGRHGHELQRIAAHGK